MTKNPFYNALFVIAYIVILVSTVFFSGKIWSGPDESIFYPMLALSTLVFSVALMAYLFFYQPVLMLIDGEREKGVKLFLHSVGIFALGIIGLLLLSLVVNG